MVRVGSRTLLQEKLRFSIAVGGVALAVALMLVLAGMYAGINRQITAYLDNAPADVVVAQQGTRNFLGASSRVPSSAIPAVRDVEGVERVSGVIAQYVVLELHGRKEFTLLVGYRPDEGTGPWAVTEGTADIGDDEVVLDEALARLRGLGVGEDLEILGREFRVAGLSHGSSTFMTGTAFVTFDSASDVAATAGNPSFLLVETAPGHEAGQVAERIDDALPDVSASSRTRVDANDIRLFAAILKGPVGFMVGVAFLVGVMLVGLTIYTATVERSKDYGALKAIGIRNRRLYAIVLEQALLSSAVGSGLGIALAFASGAVIEYLNPRFLIAIGWWLPAAVVGVALLMTVLAALAPAFAVARIDPAVAFKRGV
ncbi:MAG: ABC transporter permease [Coriobacteriia bacterium]|nr:ABC transporter permease [Coriobacteriia bacterium]